MRILPFLTAAFIFMQGAQSLKLNVTAVSAHKGSSVLECWQVDQPFKISTEAGSSGAAQSALGGAANISYTILPSNYDGGLHNAPHIQWVVFLSGLAYITLPDDPTTTASVIGGQYGLIFVADIANVSTKGHRTEYPGLTETLALQVPTLDGKIPKHKVLHSGACLIDEIAGVRDFAVTGVAPGV